MRKTESSKDSCVRRFMAMSAARCGTRVAQRRFETRVSGRSGGCSLRPEAQEIWQWQVALDQVNTDGLGAGAIGPYDSHW